MWQAFTGESPSLTEMDILEAVLKVVETFINWAHGTCLGRESETGVCGPLCAAGRDSGSGESDALYPPLLHVKPGGCLRSSSSACRSKSSPEVELQTNHALPLCAWPWAWAVLTLKVDQSHPPPQTPSSSWARESNEMYKWVDQIHGLL